MDAVLTTHDKLLEAYKDLKEAREELVETRAELEEVRGRMFRAAKVVYTARKFVEEWHNGVWSSEAVFEAGQDLIVATRKYGMGGIHIRENRDRTKASFKTPKAEEVFDPADLPVFGGVL